MIFPKILKSGDPQTNGYQDIMGSRLMQIPRSHHYKAGFKHPRSTTTAIPTGILDGPNILKEYLPGHYCPKGEP